MTRHRGWELPESHLLPDAVVAFVDQELSVSAHERAAMHLAHCSSCAEEVAAQRAASTEVRHAETPSISAGFLADLRAIPQYTDVRTAPESLAVTQDGLLVTVEHSVSPTNWQDDSPGGALGSSAPLGTSPNVLGNGLGLGSMGRRAAQGAGVVVSGIVLGALALVVTSSDGHIGGSGTGINDRHGVPHPTGGARAQMEPSSSERKTSASHRSPTSPTSSTAADMSTTTTVVDPTADKTRQSHSE